MSAPTRIKRLLGMMRRLPASFGSLSSRVSRISNRAEDLVSGSTLALKTAESVFETSQAIHALVEPQGPATATFERFHAESRQEITAAEREVWNPGMQERRQTLQTLEKTIADTARALDNTGSMMRSMSCEGMKSRIDQLTSRRQALSTDEQVLLQRMEELERWVKDLK